MSFFQLKWWITITFPLVKTSLANNIVIRLGSESALVLEEHQKYHLYWRFWALASREDAFIASFSLEDDTGDCSVSLEVRPSTVIK